jgi:hypothetical protein
VRNSALVRPHSIHKLCVIMRKKDYKSKDALVQTQGLNPDVHERSDTKPSAYAPTHYYALFPNQRRNLEAIQ